MSPNRRSGLCLGSLVLICLCLAAGAQDRGAPLAGVDPKADAILRRMSQTLGSARQFTFEADDTADQVLDNGQKVQVSRTVKLALRRPDQIAAEVVGDNDDLLYCYNGNQITIINRREHCYAQHQVPGAIDEMFDFMAEKYAMTPPLADLMFADPYKAMTGNVRAGRYLGVHQVMGVKCHHLAFRQEGIDWQIWVEDSDQALPRKVVITYKELPGYPQFTALLNKWDLKPQLPDSAFKLEPPANCKRINLVETPRDSAATQPAAR